MTTTNGQTGMVRADVHGPGLAQAGRDDGLVMVVSPAEARRRVQELQAFVQQVMVRDTDYGVIPGADKPSLYQPGAQKLAEMYGFAHDFVDVNSVEDWERGGFFFYRRKCLLTSRRDGRFIGAGIGSCNSREDRYAGRWVFESEVPKGMDLKALPSKEFQKRNGSGTFRKYRIPNPDIFSLVNTLEKMACKRSYIHAVIAVTRSAGLFTQDVEDLPEEVFGRPDQARSWERAAPPATTDEVFTSLCDRIDAAETVAALNAIARDATKAHKSAALSDANLSVIKDAVTNKRKVLGGPKVTSSEPAREDAPRTPEVQDDARYEGAFDDMLGGDS